MYSSFLYCVYLTTWVNKEYLRTKIYNLHISNNNKNCMFDKCKNNCRRSILLKIIIIIHFSFGYFYSFIWLKHCEYESDVKISFLHTTGLTQIFALLFMFCYAIIIAFWIPFIVKGTHPLQCTHCAQCTLCTQCTLTESLHTLRCAHTLKTHYT